MHEMSLVQGLLTQLHQLAREHKKSRVITVRMAIGPLSGVVIDSFQFGFDILSQEDELTKGSILVIESPPATYRCCGCGTEIITDMRPEQCTSCAETLLVPQGGDDIILRQVEME